MGVPAQWALSSAVERLTFNEDVDGSIPSGLTSVFGRLRDSAVERPANSDAALGLDGEWRCPVATWDRSSCHTGQQNEKPLRLAMAGERTATGASAGLKMNGLL